MNEFNEPKYYTFCQTLEDIRAILLYKAIFRGIAKVKLHKSATLLILSMRPHAHDFPESPIAWLTNDPSLVR